MARKHIPLTIKRPANYTLETITFYSNVADDELKIPFRYPFADISNVVELTKAGFFRHVVLNSGETAIETSPYGASTSSELGGVDTAHGKTNLGFELPNTEKLILLVQQTAVTATSATTITITGNTRLGIPDRVYTIGATENKGLFEIDLYDFGLLIEDGEINILVHSTTAANEALFDFALVARMG